MYETMDNLLKNKLFNILENLAFQHLYGGWILSMLKSLFLISYFTKWINNIFLISNILKFNDLSLKNKY